MLKNALPKEYQFFLDFISPFAFKVIRWGGLWSKIKQLRNPGSIQRNDGSLRLPGDEKEIRFATNLKIVPPAVISQAWTHRLLKLYFFQLLDGNEVCLDLRIERFGESDSEVLWAPGPLWHRFEPEFHHGLCQLYRGYYEDDEARLVEGLSLVGLLPKDKVHLKKEVVALLFSHFGQAGNGPVQFDMSKFRDSFHQLFVFLKKHDISLSSDFLFLGIYLVTLYLSLSRYPHPVMVKDCFAEVQDAFK